MFWQGRPVWGNLQVEPFFFFRHCHIMTPLTVITIMHSGKLAEASTSRPYLEPKTLNREIPEVTDLAGAKIVSR